jgi:hypothetical protein
VRWEQLLRTAVSRLPELRFRPAAKTVAAAPQEETIQLIEPPATAEPAGELQPQMSPPPRQN